MFRDLEIKAILIVAATLAVPLSACDDGNEPAAAEAERGSWAPSGKADEVATCAGSCGDIAPTGCWCDDTCADFGDCCPDKEAVCDFACPTLTPPSPDLCPDGELQAINDEESGCVVGFECIQCPQIFPPVPGFCEGGTLEARLDENGVCVIGFDCLQCPQLVPPAPGFCPDGAIEAVFDEVTQCVIGFECLPCPHLVPPAPGFCPDGTVVAVLANGQDGCITGFECQP
jgi:hypothetical protein